MQGARNVKSFAFDGLLFQHCHAPGNTKSRDVVAYGPQATLVSMCRQVHVYPRVFSDEARQESGGINCDNDGTWCEIFTSGVNKFFVLILCPVRVAKKEL